MPSQSRKDCSFQGFGLDGNYSGNPVIDLGGGKIGQLVVQSKVCPYKEKLLFVDCTNGGSATVDGVLDPVIQADLDKTGAVMLGGNYMIKYIQQPIGALGLTDTSTVAQVVAVAKKNGFAVSTDVIGDFEDNDQETLSAAQDGAYYGDLPSHGVILRSKMKKLNAPYDEFCGCKLYYPDSIGGQR